MLEPAGSSHYPGRIIGNSFESALTLHYAQELKKYIDEQLKNTVHIVLSRFPGERIEYLHNAQFSNRLGVDLYISIHFFEKAEEHPHLFIYYFALHPVTDFWYTDVQQLAFIKPECAHKKNIALTKKYCSKLYELLDQSLNKRVIIKKPIAFPFKPLYGIIAPAFAIEAQIDPIHAYHVYIKPLGDALIQLLKDIQK